MSGRGMLRGASALKNRRMGGVRQGISPPPSKELNASLQVIPYLLDDPVLDVVKCHLFIAARIGFEPISRRFSRIAFYIKNRMDMKAVGYHAHPTKSVCQLLVKRKHSRNDPVHVHPFHIAIGDEMDGFFRSLFLHIRKWRSVRGLDGTYQWQRSDRLNDLVVSSLLNAIFSIKSGPTIDVRRFASRKANERLQEKIAKFLNRGAPFLHSLSIGLDSKPLPVLMAAISGCHELRQLAIGSSQTPAGRFPPSFLPLVLGLEKLNGLLVGGFDRVDSIGLRDGGFDRLQAARRSLSVTDDWLPLVTALTFYPLLSKLQRLNVEVLWHNHNAVHITWTRILHALTQLLAQMHTVHVIIRVNDSVDLLWTEIWNGFLPLIYSTRTNMLIRLRYGMLELTPEQFAAGLSTLPAILQTSLMPPDLANAPKEYDHYLELKFRFPNGGQLTLKKRDLS